LHGFDKKYVVGIIYLGLENTSIGNTIALTEIRRGSLEDVSAGDGGSIPRVLAGEILARFSQNRRETMTCQLRLIIESTMRYHQGLVTKDCTAYESGGRDRFLLLRSKKRGLRSETGPLLFCLKVAKKEGFC